MRVTSLGRREKSNGMKVNITTTALTIVDISLDGVAVEDKNNSKDQPARVDVFVKLCLTIHLLLICTTIWVLACMVAYGRKTRKLNSRSDRTNLDGGKIYAACVVAVACSLPRLISSQVLFHVKDIPGAASECEVIIDVGVVAYYITLWLVYFFLWLRHRVIYSHPIVKTLIWRYSNIVSWILLIAVTLISLGILCGFTIPKSYSVDQNGCCLKVQDDDIWARNDMYVMAGFLILAQTSFLALFIYPMIATKRIRSSQSPPSTPSSRRAVEGIDNITTTIHRSIIGAIVTISSDLIAAVLVSAAIPSYIPRSITFAIYDVNLLINIFCITATFGSNREIMLVFFRRVRSPAIRRNIYQTDETHTTGTMNEEIL